MARVIELDDEIEHDIEGSGDILFPSLGEAVPILPPAPSSAFDLSAPPSSPIALSDHSHLLFLAHPQGFLVAKTQDVARLAKEIAEKGKGPSVADCCIADVRIGRVSALALSGDDSVLAATVDGDIRFFGVASLTNKYAPEGSEPCFSCSIKSGIVRDFKWKKNAEKSFIVLSSNGLLHLGSMESPFEQVMDNVDAVDWSQDGSIAIARKNTLSILSPNFEEQLKLQLLSQSWSTDTDSEYFIKVDSIQWVRNDSIVIGCLRIQEDGKEEGYLIQVISTGEQNFIKSSNKPVVFSFPDLFEDISDDILPIGCGPNLLLNYLDRWGLTLVSTKKAIGTHLLLLCWSLHDSSNKAVSLEFENELYTPRIGLQENGDDNLILGFVVEKCTSFEKVRVKVEAEFKELQPYSILWCLTSEGKLILFHVMRTSDSSVLPQESHMADLNTGEEEKVSTTISSKQRLPLTTCRLEDDGEKAETLGGLGMPLTGNGSGPSGRKDQGSANSKMQPCAGQSKKSEQLPVVSPHMQSSGLILRNNIKPGFQEVSFSSSGESVSTTPLIGNLSGKSSVTTEIHPRVIGRNVAELIGSTCGLEASFGSQSSGQVFIADSFTATSSLSTANRSFVGDTDVGAKIRMEQNLPPYHHEVISDNVLPGGQPCSSKESSFSPSSFMRSINKASQSGGLTSSMSGTGNNESLPSRMQPLPNNAKSYRTPHMVEAEARVSKQFYDVKEMVKELDIMLSQIEQEGGLRDTCSIFHESSLWAVEDGLQKLSNVSQVYKKKIEEQLLEIQQLQSKMLQVSTRQVYVDGMVKQASNYQYWDIWKQQKLSPELKMKQQRILEKNQSLANQLIELERHFNTLEISKFGETGGARTGRRIFHANMEPSRQVQSIQKVYSTLTSQLAAAEQLSDCLSKQMAMLNINPSSVRHPNVMKEIFESIGLSHEVSVFHTPDVKGRGLTPDFIKRMPESASINKEKKRADASSTSKVFESGSVRRRKDSLQKSITKFEPLKTIVRRSVKEGSPEFVTVKHAGISQGISHPQPTKYSRDLQKDISVISPKDTFESQSVSVFEWAKGPSRPSQSMGSESCPVMSVQRNVSQSSSSPLVSTFRDGWSSGDRSFHSPDINNGMTHTVSKSVSSMAQASSHSKIIPSMQFGASTSIQTSLISTKTSNVETTLPSQIAHIREQTSEQFSDKPGEDDQTKLSHLGVSPKNIFSLSDGNKTLSSLSSNVTGIIAQIGASPSENESPQTFSSRESNLAGSVPIPTFSTKQSSTPPMPSLVSSSIVPTSLSSSSMISASSSTISSSMSSRESSVDAKYAMNINQTISISSSASISSSSSHFAVQPLKTSAVPSQSSLSIPSETNMEKPNSEPAPLQASATVTPVVEVATLSQAAKSIPTSGVSVELAPERESSVDHTTNGSISAISCPPTSSALSFTALERDEAIDSGSSQEDEMEEEAPNMANAFNLGALGGFGLGSSPLSNSPKPNPFGGSFNTAPTNSPFSFSSSSSGDLFRPASFSLPSTKQMEPSQPVSSVASSGGFGGGFSGFGQPAQIGAGQQQALGSVLGTFGQSRQLGAGVPGVGFASSDGFGGGISAAANSGGGFSTTGAGFGGAVAGGGFTALASTTGGFSSSATGGFAAVSSATGGGFAGAATGGGFAGAAAGGGFAAAAAGGGFAAATLKGGGFALAAAAGGGFGGANPGSGFGAGGFGAFSGNQGGAFSAFGGGSSSGAGRPPTELLTQMRK